MKSPIRFLGSWEAQNVTAEEHFAPHDNKTLHLWARCLVSPTKWAGLRIAVDSGASHCAINSRVIPVESTRPLKNPIKGISMNGQQLSGGDREIRLNLQLDAYQTWPNMYPIALPTAFVVHDFGYTDVDAVVSYRWCAERGIKVDTINHRVELVNWWNNPLVIRPKSLISAAAQNPCFSQGLRDAPPRKNHGATV